MTSFAGGEGDGLMEASENEIAQTVERENARILGVTGVPIDRTIWKFPRALPQYNVGHAARVSSIQEALNGLPGLCLAGNYLAGRSIGDCAEAGFQAAEKVRTHIQS